MMPVHLEVHRKQHDVQEGIDMALKKVGGDPAARSHRVEQFTAL